LFESQKIGSGLPRRALMFSLALHGAFAGWLLWQPEPMLIQRSAVQLGENGGSLGLVYLPTDASLRLPVNEESHSLKYVAARTKTRPPKPRHVAPHQSDEHPTDAQAQGATAGSPNGDSDMGPIYGIAALPALPTKYPDPQVSRSELPPGVVGDVVVEITIDSAGNVVNRKLLQSIGYGIDEKVMAVLENWHFRPATFNGAPVASRQDVHFHFPS
jgi:TonB family protein